MKSNKTVKIIIFTAFFLSAVILISVMTGATKETTADTDSVKLPVIMYHSLLKDEKLQNDYTVSPTLFENDLKYLTENGYTTVVVKDLTDYVYGKKSLPEKCIMLTFDDHSSVFNIVSFAWAGFGGAFGAVTLCALFWKRSNKWGALAGMIGGGVMVFVWKYAISRLGGAWSIYELLPAYKTRNLNDNRLTWTSRSGISYRCGQPGLDSHRTWNRNMV